MIAGCAVAGGLSKAAFASNAIQLPARGDSPAGKQEAGPLGLNPVSMETVAKGEIPVAIVIPQADVDAEVERTKIVDGQMLDPSGPWIVAWYEGTGLPGEADNAVMSGHVDYWDVGPAVLRNVASLPEGAEITVLGANGGTFVYALEYIERVEVATLTPEKLQEIVGPTDYPALTIITCGGRFNYDAGEYYERDILRARLVNESETGAQGGEEPAAEQAPADDAAILEAGASATVSANVNLRPDASTSGDPIQVLEAEEPLTITGDKVEAEGYVWWPVTTADGTAGWVVEDYLEPAG
jgi:sortase (surface protein transpeptidase)